MPLKIHFIVNIVVSYCGFWHIPATTVLTDFSSDFNFLIVTVLREHSEPHDRRKVAPWSLLCELHETPPHPPLLYTHQVQADQTLTRVALISGILATTSFVDNLICDPESDLSLYLQLWIFFKELCEVRTWLKFNHGDSVYEH